MACKEDVHGQRGHKPLHDCFVPPQAELRVFKRYLDDCTVVLRNATTADILALAAELSTRMQPFLKIEVPSNRNHMATLFLYVHKRADFASSRKLLT